GPRLPRRRHPGDMGASAGGQGAAARRRVGPRAAQRAEGGRRVSGAAGEAGARPGGVLRLRGRVFGPGRYAVMGVVNRTPDSFYDRGATFAFEAALRAADAAVRNGADIIDVGGVKAGYGDEVSVEEEVARTAPFVAELRARHPGVVISVDTWRARVGEECLRAGADLINDTWAGADPDLARVAAEGGAGLVC